MSKQTESSLFIVSSLPRFYQRLLTGIASYKEIGSRVTKEIKSAYAFRQVERVRELSRVLINLPIKEYQLIAQYHLAWCECRKRNYQSNTLEQIIEKSQTYKAQALLTRGTFDLYQGRPESALFFYNQALKNSRNVEDVISTSLAIAQLKGIEGFHDSALKDMTTLVPIIKHADARLYYDFLNSYAVELGEAGRKYEARNIIKHVLASPFAFAYPEWQDTASELKEPNRSFISVPEIKRQTVELKQVETPKPVIKPQRPASVLSFPKLKEAPLPEKPEKLSAREFGRMTARQKKELFLTAFRTDAIRESEYDSIASMCGLLEIDPADRVIDLEDIATLDDIIAVWCNMIEPDQFATVMSALRDCDDDLRQHNIIDSMITIAFQQTRSHIESEQEWRSKVEARLPEKY